MVGGIVVAVPCRCPALPVLSGTNSGTGGGGSFYDGTVLGLHCTQPGLRGVGDIRYSGTCRGSGVPAVDLGEVVLEFGVSELVDSPRLAQHLAVVGVF